MAKAKTVKLGIIGVGNMGNGHITNIEAGKCPGIELVALCDRDASRLQAHANYRHFSDSKELIRSGAVDAVLIATPHYDHTTIGIDALKNGLHVMVEKPISVHKADCERLIKAYKDRPKKKQVFSAMFNQRTNPNFQKVRELLQSGELGELRRVNWIITTWFRSEAYYASGGWRATWGGEGGGVLLNQCPHQLDLLQWITGMPSKVHAFCRFGQWHDIEVEDDVTAYLEYPNGATGVFVTTTGETPGTNRLELVCEKGRVVVEGGKITWTRNTIEMSKYSKTTPTGFGRPDVWNIDIPVQGGGSAHAGVLQNFAEAITSGAKLLAPAVEGINSVELANAMLLSTWTNKAVELPLSGAAYERLLKNKIKNSKPKKKKKAVKKAKAADFASSY